jgi:cytochrome c-type biogenesis protein
MHDLLVGSSLIAAFLGGAVALFAPCCISVMLPAYFATSFRRKRALLSMTFVFAAGVAAIILPIAFGASGISRLIVSHHTVVFLAGGALMVAMGAATIAGWKPPLPMLGMSARRERGATSVFALGAFSGVATACCAPVLAGVLALSGAVSSFLAALAIGVAYVFGLVLPLFLIALLWDRYDWGNSTLLRGRAVSLPLPLLRRRPVQVTALISGILLMGMGGLVAVIAFTGPAMSQTGWVAEFSARLQHYASVATRSLGRLPGWSIGLVLLTLLLGLAWKAVGQAAAPETPDADAPPHRRIPAPVEGGPQ